MATSTFQVNIWNPSLRRASFISTTPRYAPYPYTQKGIGTPLPLAGTRKCRSRAKGYGQGGVLGRALNVNHFTCPSFIPTHHVQWMWTEPVRFSWKILLWLCFCRFFNIFCVCCCCVSKKKYDYLWKNILKEKEKRKWKGTFFGTNSECSVLLCTDVLQTLWDDIFHHLNRKWKCQQTDEGTWCLLRFIYFQIML